MITLSNDAAILPGQTYRVKIRSHLDRSWRAVPGVSIAATEESDEAGPTTTILLRVIDRAQLMGILNEIHATNLQFLSIELVDDADAQQE